MKPVILILLLAALAGCHNAASAQGESAAQIQPQLPLPKPVDTTSQLKACRWKMSVDMSPVQIAGVAQKIKTDCGLTEDEFALLLQQVFQN